MKTCRDCGEDRDDFMHDSRRRDGLGSYCRSCLKERNSRWSRGPGWKNSLLSTIRARAKAKGIAFNLTVDDFDIPEFCPILGIKLTVSNRVSGPDSASLDRIDPALGYVPGNVQVISVRANRMKSDAGVDDLRKFAAWVIKEFPDTGDKPCDEQPG